MAAGVTAVSPVANSADLSAAKAEGTSRGNVFSSNGSEWSYSSTCPLISPVFSEKEGIPGLMIMDKDPPSTTKQDRGDHPFSCFSNFNDGASGGAPFDGAPSALMVDVYFAPIKSQERMKEKVLKYSFPHAWSQWPLTANIRDPIRLTIACDGPSHILKIIHFFLSSQESTGLRVVRLKNKFSQADEDVREGFNGLDISLNVVFEEPTSGLKIIGEIQLHDKQILQVKSRIHKLYKIKRSEDPSMIS
jgi:hypothetical protein